MKTFTILACLIAAPCYGQVEPADIIAAMVFANAPAASGSAPSVADAAPGLAAEGATAASGVITEDDLPPGQQPTPMEAVAEGLKLLNLQPTDVLADYGCGFDCRWGITAARLYGCNVIAIEIDPVQAASAKRYVEYAGLSHLITVLCADATEMNTIANKGVAYLWPDTLENLRIKVQRLKKFVSFAYDVPGLIMSPIRLEDGGTLYVWPAKEPLVVTEQQPVAQVPITRTTRQIVRLPRGSYCEVCGGRCSNPMAHKLQTQIVGYRPATEASGHWETRKVCVNGVCSYVRTWVPN